MIIKPRKLPIKILQLEALLRRLPHHCARRVEIEEELFKYRAGYRGEKALDYDLQYIEENYDIYHGIRFFDGIHYVQIDTMLVSPSMIVILEVKNYQGTIYLDHTFHQLIRTLNGKEDGYQDPVVQVKRQQAKLKEWLVKKSVDIPIESLVVVSNPNTIIKANPHYTEALNKVILRTNLVTKLKSMEHNHTEEILTKKDRKRLTTLILKHHTPKLSNVLKQFSLTADTIQSGVICPDCSSFPMKRVSATWYCPHCTHTSKIAHISALQDYALLLDTTITNSKMRKFLHMDSVYVASKLLKSMQLPSSGENSGRVYQLPVPGWE
ncbi:NERD domain-containing protein [Bacillus sp. BGMRC 2118]|nr:NERD domain-containing protein [Bacillus sp. BGMRC 2118]